MDHLSFVNLWLPGSVCATGVAKNGSEKKGHGAELDGNVADSEFDIPHLVTWRNLVAYTASR